jgi:hypothetical protein
MNIWKDKSPSEEIIYELMYLYHSSRELQGISALKFEDRYTQISIEDVGKNIEPVRTTKRMKLLQLRTRCLRGNIPKPLMEKTNNEKNILTDDTNVADDAPEEGIICTAVYNYPRYF